MYDMRYMYNAYVMKCNEAVSKCKHESWNESWISGSGKDPSAETVEAYLTVMLQREYGRIYG